MRRSGLVVGMILLLLGIAVVTTAQQPYAGVTIRVLTQHRLEYDLMETQLDQFKADTGITVEFVYLEESDTIAKARLDASTGAGAYQVYYGGTNSIGEFAAAGWVLPIRDYYPAEYDFDDFSDAALSLVSFNGVPYYAPHASGGDYMMYRKDLLEAAGIPVPTTMYELLNAVRKLHNPPTLYGYAVRGERGFGMNVWRWASFLKGYGGDWYDSDTGQLLFNSANAVEATEEYMQMMSYGPPGSCNSNWSDNVEAFRAGRVAFIIETDVFADWMEDPAQSEVVGKVGYAPPPAPLKSAGYGYGFGISAAGCKTEKQREAAGLFIAWSTSKEQEMLRLEDGILSAFARKSTVQSPLFAQLAGPDKVALVTAVTAVSERCVWNHPTFPESGDNLGVILEELFCGIRKDVRAALDEAVAYGQEALTRYENQ